MRKILAAFAALLVGSTALAFSDVGSGNSHKNAIDYLAQHTVVSGFPDGQFKAERSINRAELAKIMVGARGEQPSAVQLRDCFSDVASQWFARFVCFAKNSNWLEGYSDGAFRPSDSVNRAEAAKIILNALGVALDDTQKFADVATTEWFAPFANTILSRNLLDASTFSANQKISRGEVAEMIYRALVMKNSSATTFSSSLAAGFDTSITPAAIVAKSLDFSNTANANFGLTNWRIENGAWVTKPTLTFNAKTFDFATPQEYLVVLKTLQKHFQLLKLPNFASDFTRFIHEFELVGGFNNSTTSSSALSVPSSAFGVSANFTNLDLTSEAIVSAQGGPSAKLGNSKIYIGYEVLPPNNSNPILISFTGGKQDWVRRDYEISADESIGYGLLWADAKTLYAVFTSRGIEEDANRDFRRFATTGWLKEYGDGNGKQVAVIAKIDPSNGNILAATFLSAREPSGATNSLNVKELKMSGSDLIVLAECWNAPRRTSGQPMDQKLSAANPPFDYEVEFTPNLQTAVRAEAPTFGQ